MSIRRLFQPRLLGLHALALVLVASAGWLGAWQVQAWQAQRSLEAADLTREQPLPVDEVIGPDDPFPAEYVGQPVLLDGSWVPEGTIYVSGRKHEGRDGFWAVTPLAVGGPREPALLVVRGWTPSVAATPPAPTGAAELVAWLQPTEGTGAVDDDPSDDVVPQLRIGDALQHVDQDLYGAYGVVADEVAPGKWPSGENALNPGTTGLDPATLEQLPPAGSFTAVRNLLYGIEWWVFGGFAAFVWWRWVRDELEPAATAVDVDDDPVPSQV